MVMKKCMSLCLGVLSALAVTAADEPRPSGRAALSIDLPPEASASRRYAGSYGRRAIPYDGTLGDRFWMWGHNPYLMNVINEGLLEKGRRSLEDAEARPNIEMPEACRYMGIRNLYVIMQREYEYGGLEAFCETLKDKGLKRIGWGVGDGDTTRKPEEKKRIGTQAARLLPNLTTWCCDDFFVGEGAHYTHDELLELRGRARLPGVNLAVVLYADQGGITEAKLKELEPFDTILLWVWNSKNLSMVEESVARLRKAYGNRKEIQLGLYMFDFGGDERLIPADVMRAQLDVAYRLIKAHQVDGLVFHCTPMVAFDVEAIRISRDWIREHKNERW